MKEKHSMTRKGQAAMEFMMTYGWALLAVLVAIGALGYFGIYSGKDNIPESCIMTTGFSCGEYYVSAGSSSTLSLQMENKLLEPITISSSKIEIDGQTIDCTVPAGIVDSEAKFTISCATGKEYATGELVKAKVSAIYMKKEGAFDHTIQGDLTMRVVPEQTTCDCNDNNVCTTDTCDGGGACVYTPVGDETICSGGTCQSGVCVPDACTPDYTDCSACGGCAATCTSGCTGTRTCNDKNNCGGGAITESCTISIAYCPIGRDCCDNTCCAVGQVCYSDACCSPTCNDALVCDDLCGGTCGCPTKEYTCALDPESLTGIKDCTLNACTAGTECNKDFNCGPGGTCEKGNCKCTTSCTPGLSCETNAECFGGTCGSPGGEGKSLECICECPSGMCNTADDCGPGGDCIGSSCVCKS